MSRVPPRNLAFFSFGYKKEKDNKHTESQTTNSIPAVPDAHPDVLSVVFLEGARPRTELRHPWESMRDSGVDSSPARIEGEGARR